MSETENVKPEKLFPSQVTDSARPAVVPFGFGLEVGFLFRVFHSYANGIYNHAKKYKNMYIKSCKVCIPQSDHRSL
jgi:hypothetical protein